MQPTMFPISDGLKDALDTWAVENDMSRAAAIRKAIAGMIGYDLEAEPKPVRTRKYANEAERKAAQKARRKAEAERVKAIMEALRKAKKMEDIEHIQATLNEK